MTPPHPPTLLPQLSITPIQAELLAEEYVCEEAAYRQGASDIFSLLRARLRSDPVLTQRCFDACDDDKDGRIVGKQVCVLCALECVVRAVCIGMRMQPVMTTDGSGFMGEQVHAMCGMWMCGWIGSVRPLQGRATAPYHCCVSVIYIPPVPQFLLPEMGSTPLITFCPLTPSPPPSGGAAGHHGAGCFRLFWLAPAEHCAF